MSGELGGLSSLILLLLDAPSSSSSLSLSRVMQAISLLSPPLGPGVLLEESVSESITVVDIETALGLTGCRQILLRSSFLGGSGSQLPSLWRTISCSSAGSLGDLGGGKNENSFLLIHFTWSIPWRIHQPGGFPSMLVCYTPGKPICKIHIKGLYSLKLKILLWFLLVHLEVQLSIKTLQVITGRCSAGSVHPHLAQGACQGHLAGGGGNLLVLVS